MYSCVLELALGDESLQNCGMFAASTYLFVLQKVCLTLHQPPSLLGLWISSIFSEMVGVFEYHRDRFLSRVNRKYHYLSQEGCLLKWILQHKFSDKFGVHIHHKVNGPWVPFRCRHLS